MPKIISTRNTSRLKKWQKIFVNRSLNLGNIRAIGYDMDHTLVVYNREAFEALAFRETLKKFIASGYPEELSKLTFDPNLLIRGLLVDMDRGNVLKVDGHKYVKIAYHGHSRLPKEARRSVYNIESFKAGTLLSMDTFFALSEVQLFAEIVDYMSRNPGKIAKSYREVYSDLRRFIDQSHADGSIKSHVLANPEKFVRRDKYLALTLRQQIEAGKTLFLLTNSSWDYTNALMSFILDGQLEDYSNWQKYFEYIVVSAGKPGFFTGSQPFYEVDPGQSSIKPLSGPLVPRTIYQGGNAKAFQQLTGFRGDEILFVGDHIYGDIIRSKHSVNWRTLLIVEELGVELVKLEGLRRALAEIHERMQEREIVDEDLQVLRSKLHWQGRLMEESQARGDLKKSQLFAKEREKLATKTARLAARLEKLDLEIKALTEARAAKVHPVWGELMKVGLERSRFADQVADYACIYTSAVSNLRFYSPFKRFSSVHDMLAHDF
jgi:HAD superfamily 5'-nucleotidase-like hydrolase